MATDSEIKERPKFYKTVKHFPPIIDGRINLTHFLEAAQDLVLIVERLGKALAPVKYDMQGNIDKIKKYSEFDENSCLLETMVNDNYRSTPLIGSVVWLNRAILFFEIVFKELIVLIKNNNINASTKKIFTVAYEGSVKKYHNWVTQQIFTVICRMGPTIPQILKAIDADSDLKAFEVDLTTMNIKLHLIRCKVDDFIKENSLYEDEDIEK